MIKFISFISFFIAFVIYIISYSKRKAKQHALFNELEKSRLERQKADEIRRKEFKEKREHDFHVFRSSIFPIASSDPLVQSNWSYWSPDIHDTETQLTKQVSAIFETIPILIDSKKMSGLFISITAEFYETTLTTCSCSDFRIRRWPCIHMYRLFHELSSVVKSCPQIVDIDKSVVSKFLSLDADCKKHFIERITHFDLEGHDTFLDEKTLKEIKSGLIVKSDAHNYSQLLNRMTKDQIILTLSKENIPGFHVSWSKVKLISWVVENHQNFLSQHFNNFAHISISPDALQWCEMV